MIVSRTTHLMCPCETVRQTPTHPSHLQIQDPESARPGLQGRECWSTEVDESREGERAASRADNWRELIPHPVLSFTFASKTQRPGRSMLLQARVPNSVLLCNCATVQLRNQDIKGQERPGQASTGATRVTPSHIGCVSGKV